MRNWFKLRLLEFDYSFDNGSLPVDVLVRLSIAGFDFSIHVSDKRLAGLLAAFEHHLVPARETEHVIHVIELNGLVHVLHNNHNVICCDDIELVPTIKAYITDQILKSSPPNIVFHAACLISDGKSMLISGRPGAGKNDAHTSPDGRRSSNMAGTTSSLSPLTEAATAIPFAPAIKPGAWEIVKQFRPDLDDAIIHRRPDGKRVRYLRPTHVALMPAATRSAGSSSSEGPRVLQSSSRLSQSRRCVD